MKKLFLLLTFLLMTVGLFASGPVQPGMPYAGQHSSIPGSCSPDGTWIFKTTSPIGYQVCQGGVYVTPGSGGSPSFSSLTVSGTITTAAIVVGVGLPGDSTVGAIGSTVQVDGTNHRFTQCGVSPTVFCMVVSNVVTNTGQCGSTTNQPVCVWTTMDQVAGVFDNSPTAGNLIGLSAAGELHDLGTATLTGVTSGQVKGVTFGAASGAGPYTATALVYPGYVAGGGGTATSFTTTTAASAGAVDYNAAQGTFGGYTAWDASRGPFSRVAGFCTPVTPSDQLAAATILTSETVFATHCTIPANWPAGKALKLHVGVAITSSASPPSLTTRIYLGGTAGTNPPNGTQVYVSHGNTMAANLTDNAAAQIILIPIAAPSASTGVIVTPVTGVGGVSSSFQPFTANESTPNPGTTAAVNVATNGSLVLQISAKFGAGTSGNTINLLFMYLTEDN